MAFVPMIALLQTDLCAVTIGDTENILARAKGSMSNKITHLKACLQGKEACSKSDFAILASGFLFAYGFIYQIRNEIYKQICPSYANKFLLPNYPPEEPWSFEPLKAKTYYSLFYQFPRLFNPEKLGAKTVILPGKIVNYLKETCCKQKKADFELLKTS